MCPLVTSGVYYSDTVIYSTASIYHVDSNTIVLSDPTSTNYTKLTPTVDSSGTDLLQIKAVNIETGEDAPIQRLEINSILSGINPTASAPGAATFGINNIATNTGSFVEGVGTLASGFAAHAAGFNTTASGYAAFSIGIETDADGTASFTAGSGSWARGTATVAFGIGTIASSSGQLAVGHYNEAKTDINNIFVVGDGTSNSLRRNVIEVYGGQGASLRGVKIDTVSPSGPVTTTIDGFNVYGRTIFYGGVTQSVGIITIDGDYGGGTHNSASYIAETYTSLGALRGRTLFNYKGIDFNNSDQTTAPSSTHLWTNSTGQLYYGSNAVILNNATNFTASNITVSNVTVTGTASINTLVVNQTQLSTGSNQLGDAVNDTQTLYGSVIIPTGSLTVTGSLTTTGDITTQNLTVANITASENIRIGRTKSVGGNNFGTYNPILTYWNDGSTGAIQSASFGFRGSAYIDSIAYPDIFGFGTNDLRFFASTNGIATPTEIIRVVGSTGFVGIGETSPSAKLEIKGSGATSATTAFRVENSSATSLLTVLNDGTSAFNTSHLYVSSSGLVGIGTTTPVHNLVVNGTSGISINSNGTTFPNIHRDSSDGGMLLRSWDGSTFTNNVKITPTSNVGIGTTSPSVRLHVSGTSTTNELVYLTGDASQGSAIRFNRGSSYSWRMGVTNASNFTIEDTSYSTARFQISHTSGLVGINTTSPNARLHISGANNEALLIVSSSTAPSALFVSGSGNVGIGTATPSASLQVQGNFQISTGSLYTYGQNTDIDSGSFRTVVTVPTSSYRAAFFDYVLTSGSNARAGTVFSVWQGTSVEYADTSTNDIGNTTGVNLLVSMSGANIGLFASSSNDNWSMKALARMI